MKVAWPTLAALTLAVVALFCLWRFFPGRPEAIALAGALSAAIMSQFGRLLGKTGNTVPPPPPGAP